MAKLIHFIVQGEPVDIHKHFRYAYLHKNMHTDPQYFMHLKYLKYSATKAWEAISEAFDLDLSVDEIQEACSVGYYSCDTLSIFQVSEIEAEQWLQEANSYSCDDVD